LVDHSLFYKYKKEIQVKEIKYLKLEVPFKQTRLGPHHYGTGLHNDKDFYSGQEV